MWVQANGKTTLKWPKHRSQAMKHMHIGLIGAIKPRKTTKTGDSFNNRQISARNGRQTAKITRRGG
jgi:hypothetical protein